MMHIGLLLLLLLLPMIGVAMTKESCFGYSRIPSENHYFCVAVQDCCCL